MGPVALVKTLWAGKKLQDAWKKAIWRKSLMGWKTVLGAVLLGVGTTLSALEDAGVLVGGKAIAAGLQGVGGALGLYGLRSAIAKSEAKLPIAILGLWLALGSPAMAECVTEAKTGLTTCGGIYWEEIGPLKVGNTSASLTMPVAESGLTVGSAQNPDEAAVLKDLAADLRELDERSTFAVRLGASVAPGQKAGVASFVLGAGQNKSVNTIVAQRDDTGRITQAFAAGVERELFTIGRVTFAASGAAGVAYNPDNVSGLAQGASTVLIKAWKGLSVVLDGIGTNSPALGGEWDGTFRLSAQWDF